jgi:site-specific recombinase XerD
MFEELLVYPAVLRRHQAAPWAMERARYLAYRMEQGYARPTLLRLMRELRVVAPHLDLSSGRSVSPAQIAAAADQWARRQRRRGLARSPTGSRHLFVQVATEWLRFLGRLPTPVPEPVPGSAQVEAFLAWMQQERRLAPATIRGRRWHLLKFLQWYAPRARPLAAVTGADLDAFLTSLGQQGWSRVSLAASAATLRAFFRQLEQTGGCRLGLAATIAAPRRFAQETCPAGPAWGDVERLLASTATDRPRDLRDRALLLLCAVYGLRASEVVGLRLDHLDWGHAVLWIPRAKAQGRTQPAPLVPTVGEAILAYLQRVRPRSARREVFLTLRAPFRPLSPDGLYHATSSRLTALGSPTPHRGPHALRHACAMRLVAAGCSLKVIGDHLGHRSTSATRLYAKVDLAALREVAALELGGVA